MKQIVRLTENVLHNILIDVINEEFKKGSNHPRSTFYGDLYHSDIYMPKILSNKAMDMFLIFKNNTKINPHSINNRGCDDCHTYDIDKIQAAIKRAGIGNAKIFEIGTEYALEYNQVNTNILKFAVRMPYDDKYDVIVVYTNEGNVKTVWLNPKDDIHRTLDIRKYVPNPNRRR